MRKNSEITLDKKFEINRYIRKAKTKKIKNDSYKIITNIFFYLLLFTFTLNIFTLLLLQQYSSISTITIAWTNVIFLFFFFCFLYITSNTFNSYKKNPQNIYLHLKLFIFTSKLVFQKQMIIFILSNAVFKFIHKLKISKCFKKINMISNFILFFNL